VIAARRCVPSITSPLVKALTDGCIWMQRFQAAVRARHRSSCATRRASPLALVARAKTTSAAIEEARRSNRSAAHARFARIRWHSAGDARPLP
jgi:hypothetical protein